MVKKSRTGLMVGLALLAGVAVGAVGAVGMLSLRGGDGPYATVPPPSTRGMGAAPATTAFVTAVSGNCEMHPVLASAGDGDGQAQLQAKPEAASADEVASLILSGKEAAASGHRRDAEIDFLNACRNAVALQGGDPIPLADAMYQLARHYATVAAFGQGNGKELYPRAARLYSASLEAYRARYGEDSEKTRFAREGLVTVQQATGGKPPTAIAKTAPPPAAAPVAAAPASAPVAAASAPAPAPVAAASAPAPVAAASAPAPVAAAKPAADRKDTEVANTEPATPRARTVHREARRPAPIVTDDNDNQDHRASRREEGTAAAAPPSPRETAPVRATERRSEPDTSAAAADEPAPRSQARRAPARTSAEDDGAVAVDAPPPPPRRPRVAPSYSAEPAPLPPPDYGSSGAGPAPAQAEGSPNAE